MPRFVLLRHESAPRYKPDHWDLMLEHQGVLLTWELLRLPSSWEQVLEIESSQTLRESVPAMQLPDHRLAYLAYEGPISGDRGTVRRVAGGEFELLELEQGRLRCRLHDGQLGGEWVLTRSGQSQEWVLQPCQRTH